MRQYKVLSVYCVPSYSACVVSIDGVRDNDGDGDGDGDGDDGDGDDGDGDGKATLHRSRLHCFRKKLQRQTDHLCKFR